ncbi:MAG TPA: DUF2911 domain-containing protein [Polyangia bacterium]|jgi:hypothetical protein|nr:DUF2911 domain-containing protein [Polyangia bacterium]
MRASSFAVSIGLVTTFATFSSARADVELPRAVPAAKLTQQVGLTEITVEYECTAVAGRKIWGGVVPYGEVWTMATGTATRLKLSRDVTLGDRAVPAGSYWLLAIPTKTTWTVIVNKSPDPPASARDYRPDLDVARLKVSARSTTRRERLAFSFSELTDDRASLDLEWETLRVSIPIQLNTTQQVLSSIDGLDGTWRSFANAARYMLEKKKDYDAGLKYADEALALKDDWYTMWVKGALLAGKGDYAGAADWAARAHDLEQKVGGASNLEADLVKAIATWSKKAHRPDAHALAKMAPGAAEGPRAPVEVTTAPPSFEQPGADAPAFKSAGEQEPVKTPSASPPDDLPLRRSRLRHR